MLQPWHATQPRCQVGNCRAATMRLGAHRSGGRRPAMKQPKGGMWLAAMKCVRPSSRALVCIPT